MERHGIRQTVNMRRCLGFLFLTVLVIPACSPDQEAVNEAQADHGVETSTQRLRDETQQVLGRQFAEMMERLDHLKPASTKVEGSTRLAPCTSELFIVEQKRFKALMRRPAHSQVRRWDRRVGFFKDGPRPSCQHR